MSSSSHSHKTDHHVRRRPRREDRRSSPQQDQQSSLATGVSTGTIATRTSRTSSTTEPPASPTSAGGFSTSSSSPVVTRLSKALQPSAPTTAARRVSNSVARGLQGRVQQQEDLESHHALTEEERLMYARADYDVEGAGGDGVDGLVEGGFVDLRLRRSEAIPRLGRTVKMSELGGTSWRESAGGGAGWFGTSGGDERGDNPPGRGTAGAGGVRKRRGKTLQEAGEEEKIRRGTNVPTTSLLDDSDRGTDSRGGTEEDCSPLLRKDSDHKLRSLSEEDMIIVSHAEALEAADALARDRSAEPAEPEPEEPRSGSDENGVPENNNNRAPGASITSTKYNSEGGLGLNEDEEDLVLAALPSEEKNDENLKTAPSVKTETLLDAEDSASDITVPDLPLDGEDLHMVEFSDIQGFEGATGDTPKKIGLESAIERVLLSLLSPAIHGVRSLGILSASQRAEAMLQSVGGADLDRTEACVRQIIAGSEAKVQFYERGLSETFSTSTWEQRQQSIFLCAANQSSLFRSQTTTPRPVPRPAFIT